MDKHVREIMLKFICSFLFGFCKLFLIDSILVLRNQFTVLTCTHGRCYQVVGLSLEGLTRSRDTLLLNYLGHLWLRSCHLELFIANVILSLLNV